MLGTGRENEGIIVTRQPGKGKQVAQVVAEMANIPGGYEIRRKKHQYPDESDIFQIRFLRLGKAGEAVALERQEPDLVVKEIITTDYPDPFSVRFLKTGHFVLDVVSPDLERSAFEDATERVNKFFNRPLTERISTWFVNAKQTTK